MSDQGWRQGDEAAWWDGGLRCWRKGTLTARHTVPTYVYDVSTDDGVSVAIPERLLRGIEDPGVTLESRSDPPRSVPPVRPGSSLADRSRR